MSEEYLKTIEKLQKCTESYWGYCNGRRNDYEKIEKIASELEPCKECALLKKFPNFEKQPYCVLYPFPKETKIMFISRDPNFSTPQECKDKHIKWPADDISVVPVPPNDFDISDGIIKALLASNTNNWESEEWRALEGIIRGEKKETPVYWTHLVKCFTMNNKNKIIKEIKGTCIKILGIEIQKLKPKLIICVGGDAAWGLKNLLKNKEIKNLYPEAKKLFDKIKDIKDIKQWLEKLEEAIQTGIIVLPHPSKANGNYGYKWKDGYNQAIVDKKREVRISILSLKLKIDELLGRK